MAEARVHYAEFKDLPPYAGPGTATEARKAIALLTEFAQEKNVGAVDANVEACKGIPTSMFAIELSNQACLRAALSRPSFLMARHTGAGLLRLLPRRMASVGTSS